MNETELLFSEVLKCDRVSLYQNPGLKLSRCDSEIISAALKRRAKGEPLQYILGKTEFMGLEFKLDRNVLIPRPETEILVETTLQYATQRPRDPETQLQILDIGTGSGCIAVSLAKLLEDIKVVATDISEKAITVAKENAALNKVEDKIDFIRQDLFGLQLAACSLKLAACSLKPSLFNFIVSNPPYIPSAEIETLQREIRFEPRIALDGGRNGLDFYRRIIKEAPNYLAKEGYLILEIGFNQKIKIEKIFYNSKDFEIIETVKDYNNIDRVVIAQKNN